MRSPPLRLLTKLRAVVFSLAAFLLFPERRGATRKDHLNLRGLHLRRSSLRWRRVYRRWLRRSLLDSAGSDHRGLLGDSDRRLLWPHLLVRLGLWRTSRLRFLAVQ